MGTKRVACWEEEEEEEKELLGSEEAQNPREMG